MRARHGLASWRWASLVLVTLFLATRLAHSNPTPGFVENWPGVSLEGWTGGAEYSNPGTGGVGGAGDGFLIIRRSGIGNLGGFSAGPEYAGNWQAAGITTVRLWLKDIAGNENLEIHVAIGNQSNFWQYLTGFLPPETEWQEFIVDLTSSAGWTQILGFGSFDNALQNADRILLRHDVAPYTQSPNAIRADFGVDNLSLTGASTAAHGTTWGRLKAIYR